MGILNDLEDVMRCFHIEGEREQEYRSLVEKILAHIEKQYDYRKEEIE